MSQEELAYDPEDKKVYLALQKAGELLPCDIESDESIADDDLPAGLRDIDSAVKKIMASGKSGGISIQFPQASNPDPQPDLALAARHGVKLSDASLEKIRKLRESSELQE